MTTKMVETSVRCRPRAIGFGHFRRNSNFPRTSMKASLCMVEEGDRVGALQYAPEY